MKILWIWNSKGDGFPSPDYRKDGESFQKHNEYMRGFRLAHRIMETIDSKDTKTIDWSALIPIQKVKIARHVQN